MKDYIIYSDPSRPDLNNHEILIRYIDLWIDDPGGDYTTLEKFERQRQEIKDSYEEAKYYKTPPNKNCGLIFQQELEGLLERRNLDEIQQVYSEMVSRSPHIVHYPNPKRSLYSFERRYYEVFRNIPTFRKELIKTDLNELMKETSWMSQC